MIYTKKKCYIIILVLLISFIVGYLNFFKKNTLDINSNNILFSQKNKECLENSLLQLNNKDGGYHDFLDALNIKSNLYSTYYCLKCLNLLKVSINTQDSSEILDWCNNIPIEYLLNSEKFDNLSDIFYLTEIFKMQNIKIKNNTKLKILSFLKEVQNSNGTFALSRKHKNTNDDKDIYFLSTFYAIEIIKNLNGNLKDFNNIYPWINEMFFKIDDTSLKYCSQFLSLLKISKNVNFDTTKFTHIIEKKFKSYNNLFNEIINKDITKLPVIFLNDFLELNSIVNNKCIDLKLLNIIDKYFYSLQNSNGAFSIIKEENPNILPTYIILDYFTLLKKEIPKKNILIDLIQSKKLNNQGYTSLTTINSDINATYYCYQINNICNNHKNKSNLILYLKNLNNNILNSFNKIELFYYLKLCKELNIDSRLNFDINYFENEIIKLIKNKTSLSPKEYFLLRTNLQIMHLMKYEVNTSLKKKLINLIVKENNNNEFFEECLKIQILSLLNFNNTDYFKNSKNNLIAIFNNTIDVTNPNIKLAYAYNLYLTLNCLNVKSVDDITKKKIKLILKNCINQDGSFKYYKNGITSVQSTFLGLYILNSF